MRKLIAMLAILLSLVLLLPCVSGIAESEATAGQPISYIDQDTFIAWLRTYDPEAKITWEPWYYVICFFNGKDVSTVTADLSEDQSTVLAAAISVLNDIPKQAQSIINALCKVMKDKLSSKSLKELKTGEWENAKEVLSDKGKLSFSYDTRKVGVRFLVDESELLPVDTFYKTVSVKKVYGVRITRHGVISKLPVFSADDYFSLSEEERIKYSTESHTAYTAEINLDDAGRVTSISVSAPTETIDAEAVAAFLQDAASRLASGSVLESVSSVISEKLSSVMDPEIQESVYEEIGTLYFRLFRNADHISMSFSVNEPIPEDAARFINGQ